MAYMKLTEGTRAAMADKVRDAADKDWSRAQKTWTKEKDERNYKEMLAMHKQDKKDLYQIADHIDSGRLDLAGKLAMKIDTGARDNIPSSVFDMI